MQKRYVLMQKRYMQEDLLCFFVNWFETTVFQQIANKILSFLSLKEKRNSLQDMDLIEFLKYPLHIPVVLEIFLIR